MSQRQAPAALTSLSDVSAGGRRLPFRVRPEARQIWLQHTGGTVGALLQSNGPPAAPLGSDAVSARDKLRTNRSQGRLSGGGRQPIRALPINGVTEEALSCSRSASSVTSFVTSPRSPRRHIDLNQLSGDMSTVEGVHGVRVISPGRPQPPGGDGAAQHSNRNGEVITSPGEGIPARGSEIPLRRELIASSAAVCHSSPSVSRRQSPPLTDVDRCLSRFANVERTLPPFPSSNGTSRAVPTRNGGEGFSSPRTNGGGFSSPGGGGEGIPSRVGGDRGEALAVWAAPGADRERTVRLVAPGDTSDRSDGSSRRDRIMSLIGNLRRPAGDADGARAVDEEVREMRQLAGSVTSESPVTRFSDESRQSFREMALERARVSYPYRSAPSLAPNRKLKSSDALRDGVAGRLAHGKPSTRLLNKRKSQSVTKLAEAPPPPGKLTNKSQSVTRLATGSEEPASASSPFGVVQAARSDDRVPPVPLPADGGFASQQPQPSPRHSQSSSDTKTSVDFVRRNRQLASTHCSRRSRSLTRAEPTSENRPPPGTVPRYLVRRQQQWRQAAEERERLAPDPACPPNHTLMADDDRRRTLDVLTQNHQTLLTELRSLPIAHSSSRLVALRSDLEQQLKKVEEGVRIFSMAKVFVKNDT